MNPSSADGLGACSSGSDRVEQRSEPSCPDNAKLGTVTIDTPLLDVPVTGNIYLAKPFDNPFNALVAVYIVASAKGVVIKLPGLAVMDARTGQISTTFDNNPQLPFSQTPSRTQGRSPSPIDPAQGLRQAHHPNDLYRLEWKSRPRAKLLHPQHGL